MDDLEVEEVGLLNVLRRPGTPVTVRSEATGELYEEGKDFAPIKDEKLNFRFDHEPPKIKLLPGGRIKDGQRLKVSYYHGMGVNSGQVSVCMSEPEVYQIWEKQAELMHKYLAPSKYLLSMDEIRAGGACEACKQRNLSMAQILGDCITKQVSILRRANPKTEVFIWSDMLDPNHNAHGNYYLVEGDYTDSWQYVPKDLTIVCWYYEKRNESLAFFSSHGFQTLAGAYYDGDTLDNPRGWLDVLDKTPQAVGIMYTTWQNKYELLAPFGDLVARAEQMSLRGRLRRCYLRTQTASGTRTHSATLSKMANWYRAGSGPTKPVIMSWPRTMFANGPLVSMSTPPPGRAGALMMPSVTTWRACSSSVVSLCGYRRKRWL